MKKVLFTATAVAATLGVAGVAAADVRVSGLGRFGLDYNSGNPGQSDDAEGSAETSITSRLRLQFDMETETDGGVALGARLRLQTENRDETVDGDGLDGTTSGNGARFFVGFGGLTVFVGNIIGAMDNLPDLYLPTTSASIGIDGMGFQHIIFPNFSYDSYSSGGTGPVGVEAIYSAGGFTGHISYSSANGTGGDLNDNRIGLMASYAFDAFRISAAYQIADQDDNDIYGITGSYSGDTWGVQAGFADNDGEGTAFMVAGNIDVGAAGNIVLFVSQWECDKEGCSEDTAYGIEYNYDLGGSSTFVVGLEQDHEGETQAQAGVFFRF